MSILMPSVRSASVVQNDLSIGSGALVLLHNLFDLPFFPGFSPKASIDGVTCV